MKTKQPAPPYTARPDAPPANDDDVPGVQNETVSKEGDIWLLGEHRLMCGDSTNLEHVEHLVDNQRDCNWNCVNACC